MCNSSLQKNQVFLCGCFADKKLRRKFGHETLCKMDLMDLVDLMDMPQWQQNQPPRHACGNVCGQHKAYQQKTKLIPGAKP